MKIIHKLLRIIGLILLSLLAILLIAPFLIPIPPLENVVDPEDLADSDSQFAQLRGIQVHYKARGQGQPALLLLHGFAASLYSWREVMPGLSQDYTVAAFDRPGFGLTERPISWQGENPYSSQAAVHLTIAMLDHLGIQQAVLVGNSAGGTVALQTALQYPERVKALILVDPAVYVGSPSSPFLRLLFQLPQVQRLGPLFMRNIQKWGLDFGRSAWHDPSKITDEVWQGYTLPLKAKNWDRGLWEFLRASQPMNDLPPRLGEIHLPVLVITGDDDRIVPTQQSRRLAQEIPGAQLVVIPNCGHVPQEECPQAFLEAVQLFIQGLD